MLSQFDQDDLNMYTQLKQIIPILSLSENHKYKIYRENLEEQFYANDSKAINSAFQLLSFYAMSEHKLLKNYSKEIYNFFETGFKSMDAQIRHRCFLTYLQYVYYYQKVSITFRSLIPALFETIIYLSEVNRKMELIRFESALYYLELYLPQNRSFFRTECVTILNGLKAILQAEQIPYQEQKLAINLIFEISNLTKSIKPQVLIEIILDFIFKAMLSISLDISESWTVSNDQMRKRYDANDHLTFNIGEICFLQLVEQFKWENVKDYFSIRVQEALNCDWRGIYSVLILCSSIISYLNEDEQKEIIRLCQNYKSDSNPKVRLATLHTYHSLFQFSINQKNQTDAQFILNYMIEQLEAEKNNKLISYILHFISEQILQVNLSPQPYNFLVQFIIDQIRKRDPLSTIYSLDLLINLLKKDANGLKKKQNEITELLISLKEQENENQQENENMNVSVLVCKFLSLIQCNIIQQ